MIDVSAAGCVECRVGNHRRCTTRVAGFLHCNEFCACWARNHFDECEPWASDFDDADGWELAKAADRYERMFYGGHA